MQILTDGAEPEAADTADQGLGWETADKDVAKITSGLEGAWTTHPDRWDNEFFKLLFKYKDKFVSVRSPAGANQWESSEMDIEDMPAYQKTHQSSVKSPCMTATWH